MTRWLTRCVGCVSDGNLKGLLPLVPISLLLTILMYYGANYALIGSLTGSNSLFQSPTHGFLGPAVEEGDERIVSLGQSADGSRIVVSVQRGSVDDSFFGKLDYYDAVSPELALAADSQPEEDQWQNSGSFARYRIFRESRTTSSFSEPDPNVATLAAAEVAAPADVSATTPEPNVQQYNEIMVVEIRSQTMSGPTGERIRIVADVAAWFPSEVPSGGEPVLRKLKWWLSEGLAKNNSILEVHQRSPWSWMRTMSFPTSQSSLVSWLRRYWLPTAGAVNKDYKSHPSLKLSEKELDSFVADSLIMVMSSDWGDLGLRAPVIWLRVLNGWVQFLTVLAFVALLLCFASRLVIVQREYSQRAGITKRQIDSMSVPQANAFTKPQADFRSTWGCNSEAIRVWISVIESWRAGGQPLLELPAVVKSGCSLAQDTFISRSHLCRTLLGCLGALGFIGTVIGMGDAMQGTGEMLSEVTAKLQSGVLSLGLMLAFAFDTTLIALVLAVAGTFIGSYVTRREERFVIEMENEYTDLLTKSASTKST